MTKGANVKSHSIAGHKEMSIEEKERRAAKSLTAGKDVEKLLDERVLSNQNISRAALYDKDDCAQMAGSVQRFDLEEPHVRGLLDGLLAAQRDVEGTNTVTGAAPSSFSIEGTVYKFADKTTGSAILEAADKPDLFLVLSAHYFVLAEGSSAANRDSVKTVMASFAEGLQSQGL